MGPFPGIPGEGVTVDRTCPVDRERVSAAVLQHVAEKEGLATLRPHGEIEARELSGPLALGEAVEVYEDGDEPTGLHHAHLALHVIMPRTHAPDMRGRERDRSDMDEQAWSAL